MPTPASIIKEAEEKFKYVRDSIEGFAYWPESTGITHREMAHKKEMDHVVSAGFAYIEDGKAQCFGMSVSLNKRSLPEDSELLSGQLNV